MLDHDMNVMDILDDEDSEDLIPTPPNEQHLNATSKQPLDVEVLLTNPGLFASPDPVFWDAYLISVESCDNP
jgi:hypothetical protein